LHKNAVNDVLEILNLDNSTQYGEVEIDKEEK